MVTAVLQVVLLHVVPDKMEMAADLKDGMMLPTLEGLNLTVSITGKEVMIQAPMRGTEAMVVKPDGMAGESVVHIIDDVLIPGDVDIPGVDHAMAPGMEPMMGPSMGPGMAPGMAAGPAAGPAGAGTRSVGSSAASVAMGAAGMLAAAAAVL
jgi:Fasciclin domain